MGVVMYKEDGKWVRLFVPTDVDDTVLHALEQMEQRAADIERELDNIDAYISLYGNKDGE